MLDFDILVNHLQTLLLGPEEECFAKFDPDSFSYKNPMPIPHRFEALDLVMIMTKSTIHISSRNSHTQGFLCSLQLSDWSRAKPFPPFLALYSQWETFVGNIKFILWIDG